MEQPQNVRRQLQAMRLPLLMAAVAALLFTLPAQTTEIYRALAQTAVQTDWTKPAEYKQILIELCLAASGILVLSILLWFAARRAASIFQLRTHAGAGDVSRVDFTTRPKLMLWLPRLLLLAVPLAAASGILHADVQPGFVEKVKDAMVDVFKLQFIYSGLSDEFAAMFAIDTASKILLFSTWLTYFAKLLLAGSGVLFLVIFMLDRPWLARHLARQKSWNSWVTVPFAAMAIGGIIATVLVYPVAIPQRLGALFIMSLFLIMVLLILLQLRTWRQKTGVPFVAIFLICALVFAVFDLNDNHSIRSLPGNKAVISHDEGLPNAFNRWLTSRADVERFAGKPYPVYIVAAQGGGIYAATHVASFLGEVQDLCPGFGHHLFAISGVSGGSIGASVFAALTQDVDWASKSDQEKFGCAADVKAERATPFQFATTSIFRQDLWSPLAASLLFPDFFQRSGVRAGRRLRQRGARKPFSVSRRTLEETTIEIVPGPLEPGIELSHPRASPERDRGWIGQAAGRGTFLLLRNRTWFSAAVGVCPGRDICRARSEPAVKHCRGIECPFSLADTGCPFLRKRRKKFSQQHPEKGAHCRWGLF